MEYEHLHYKHLNSILRTKCKKYKLNTNTYK